MPDNYVNIKNIIKDFNLLCSNDLNKKNENDVSDGINHSLTLLEVAPEESLFEIDPNSCDGINFLIHIQNIMIDGQSDSNGDQLSHCITALEKLAKIKHIRDCIVDKLHFMPSLCHLLQLSTKGSLKRVKTTTLLTLIEELTYGIRIKRFQSYLTDLIKILLEFIDKNDNMSSVALSILINICFNNTAPISILSRIVHPSVLSKNLVSFGVLGTKMILLLDEDSLKENNITNWFNYSKDYMIDAFKTQNTIIFRHCLDFLIYIQNIDQFYTICTNFDFQELINELLMIATSPDSLNGLKPNKCIQLVFEMINCVIMSSNKSLANINEKIENFALDFVLNHNISVEALNTIRLTIRFDKIYDLNKLELVLDKIANTINLNRDYLEIIALLKILVVLRKDQKLTSIKFDTNQFFNEIYKTFQTLDRDIINLHTNGLLMYIHYLYAVMQFEDKQDAFREILQNKQIQYLIARSLDSNNKELRYLTLQLARSPDLPILDISKLSSESSSFDISNNDNMENDGSNGSSNINGSYRNKVNHIGYISSANEANLTKLINKLSNAISNHEIINVETAEFVELYTQQFVICKRTEDDLRQQLQNSERQIARLLQRTEMQSAEIERLSNMHFIALINKKSLLNDIETHQTITKRLKDTVQSFKSVTDTLDKQCKTNEKQINEQNKVIEGLEADLFAKNKQNAAYQSEIKELKKYRNETNAHFEILKKDKDLLAEELARSKQQNEKIMKCNKEDLNKKDILLKEFDTKLRERDERIEELQEDIKEQDDVRKSIMSMMSLPKKKK